VANDPNQAFDFEKALAELEAIVQTMERGELGLDAALEHFERGIALTRRCQAVLAEAEQRVQQLVEQNGELRLEPFHGARERDDD